MYYGIQNMSNVISETFLLGKFVIVCMTDMIVY